MELRNNPQFGSSALGLSEKGGEPLTAIELTAVNKLEQYKCKVNQQGILLYTIQRFINIQVLLKAYNT